ncbi:MAG: class I SAM-dependent methyltransferase [Myxococcota bacterium]
MRYPQGLRAFFVASPLLAEGLRVLDAGCGTGAVTLALVGALRRRGLAPGPIHAFDLTPAMLERFRVELRKRDLEAVETTRANVLELEALPPGWTGYDLVVSASMLEYVPRDRLVDALRGLRGRLGEGGHLLLFITRRNWLTRPLIGRWWRSNLYGADELRDAFRRAGFSRFAFAGFPPAARHLSVWGHVIVADR